MEGNCQQTLRGWTPYWQEKPECGKPARFTWVSDLRGKVRLCRRHAKSVGLENCEPLACDLVDRITAALTNARQPVAELKETCADGHPPIAFNTPEGTYYPSGCPLCERNRVIEELADLEERCAKIAEKHTELDSHFKPHGEGHRACGLAIAAAIRNSTEPQTEQEDKR